MSDLVRVAFTPQAELEFEEARAWYERQRPGLGSEFAVDIDDCLEKIRQSPLMYARAKKDYRCVLAKRFPYAVYYEFEQGLVTVYTVFHCSQDPAKLGQRLP